MISVRKMTRYQRTSFACDLLRILANQKQMDGAPTTRGIILSVIDIISAPTPVRAGAINWLKENCPELVRIAEERTPSK